MVYNIIDYILCGDEDVRQVLQENKLFGILCQRDGLYLQ